MMLLLHGVSTVSPIATLVRQVSIFTALEASEWFTILSHWVFAMELSTPVFAFSFAFMMTLKMHFISPIIVVEIIPVDAIAAKVLMRSLSISGIVATNKSLLESSLPGWLLIVSSMHPLRHHVVRCDPIVLLLWSHAFCIARCQPLVVLWTRHIEVLALGVCVETCKSMVCLMNIVGIVAVLAYGACLHCSSS